MNTSSKSLTWEFDLICLNNYLANQNAAAVARHQAEGTDWYVTNALTSYDLHRMGVYTVEQYKLWARYNDDLEAAKEDRKNSY
jgi:hypothetical protein